MLRFSNALINPKNGPKTFLTFNAGCNQERQIASLGFTTIEVSYFTLKVSLEHATCGKSINRKIYFQNSVKAFKAFLDLPANQTFRVSLK